MFMFRKLSLTSVALVAGLFLAGSVMAVTAPAAGIQRFGTMVINATAIAACNLSAVPSLNFGNYDANADITIGDTVQVICNSASPYTVDLSVGDNNTACVALKSTNVRCLNDGSGNLLAYNITEDGPSNFFVQATGSTWRMNPCSGDEWLGQTGSSAGDGDCHIEAVGNGSSTNHLLLATLPGNQTISGLGAYTDSVVVTLNF